MIYLIFALITAICGFTTARDRSFVIDYANNQFLKDGQPFRYISGSLHYCQVPADYWEDRLTRLRSMGLNVIQTYVVWNLHEPLENQYEFEFDRANLERFLQIADKLGLLVIIRPGPYIDAEKDMGGLPAWLLKTPDIELRTMDPVYIAAVTKWYSVVLPKLRPYLYKNGGPIIMVQIENEYGSYYACDRKYTNYLRDLVQKYLGVDDVVYFTTDGGAEGYLKCGAIPGVYATVDFGPGSTNDTKNAFKAQRTYSPYGPLVNSEFYPGWFDQWGDKEHHRVDIDPIVNTVIDMWTMNASFNFYPIHGGTNWGYSAGAEGYLKAFSTVITSYDYDAPISEAGDLTPKYFALRQTIERLTQMPVPFPVPNDNEKFWYGRVNFTLLSDLFQLTPVLCPDSRVIRSKTPLTAENLDQPYGFILYETTLIKSGKTLNLSVVNDRGYVFVDGEFINVVQRPYKDDSTALLPVSLTAGAKLQILVENQGRICFGPATNDRKGIVGNVTLDGDILFDWVMRPLNLTNIHYYLNNNKKMVKLSKRSSKSKFVPSFYLAQPELWPRVGDTFLDPSGWGKGQLLVNGYNIGRYWPDKGPQVTLYLPKPYLSQKTQLIMFELEKPGNCASLAGSCSAKLVNQPNLGKDDQTRKGHHFLGRNRLLQQPPFKNDVESANF